MGPHEAFGYLKLHDRTLQKQKIVSLTSETTLKNTDCFHFCEWKQQHTDIWNLKLNRNDSRGHPIRDTPAGGGKRGRYCN